MTDEEVEKELTETHGIKPFDADTELFVNHVSVDKCSSRVDNRNIPPPIPYVKIQQQEDTLAKRLVANYALMQVQRNKIVRKGEPVYIDAGSSPMQIWESIKRVGLDFSSIYTSNYLIIRDWMESVYLSPEFSNSKVILVGDVLDPEHGAFYGGSLVEKMKDPSFRPAAMFVGCAGIEFDEDHGIFYGYHGDDLEAKAKQSYFKCRSKMKIILATPGKIGNSGGDVFNLKNIKNFDKESPVCLITTEPAEDQELDSFYAAEKVFESGKFFKLVRSQGIDFHWIILDAKTGEFKREVSLGSGGEGQLKNLRETSVIKQLTLS